MTENKLLEETNIRQEFNEIAENYNWMGGNLPDNRSWEDLSVLSNFLHEQVQDRVEIYDGITDFTRAEAQVWVLVTTTGPDNTLLTLNGVALAMSTPDNLFRRQQEPTPGWREDVLSSGYMERLYESASEKIEGSESCIDYSSCREERIDDPEQAHLDRSTIQRLEARGHYHGTLDDVVTHLLNSTGTHLTLEDFIRRYLDNRGANDVAQITIDHQSMKNGDLVLTAHTGLAGDLPDVINETDELVIGDRYYRFSFEEDASSPFHSHGRTSPFHSSGRTTIYRRANASAKDSVPLETGTQRIHDQLAELREQEADTPSNKQ